MMPDAAAGLQGPPGSARCRKAARHGTRSRAAPDAAGSDQVSTLLISTRFLTTNRHPRPREALWRRSGEMRREREAEGGDDGQPTISARLGPTRPASRTMRDERVIGDLHRVGGVRVVRTSSSYERHLTPSGLRRRAPGHIGRGRWSACRDAHGSPSGPLLDRDWTALAAHDNIKLTNSWIVHRARFSGPVRKYHGAQTMLKLVCRSARVRTLA